jgi:ABC-type uncharacterized transport system YnjBCD ATPase subunit
MEHPIRDSKERANVEGPHWNLPREPFEKLPDQPRSRDHRRSVILAELKTLGLPIHITEPNVTSAQAGQRNTGVAANAKPQASPVPRFGV